MSFALTIRERLDSWAGRAPVMSVHESQPQAVAALAEYVRENWDTEIGEEAPSDEGEMVQRYFDEVPEAFDIKISSIAQGNALLFGGRIFSILAAVRR